MVRFSNGEINRAERKQKKKGTKRGGSDLLVVKLLVVQLVKESLYLEVH